MLVADHPSYSQFLRPAKGSLALVGVALAAGLLLSVTTCSMLSALSERARGQEGWDGLVALALGAGWAVGGVTLTAIGAGSVFHALKPRWPRAVKTGQEVGLLLATVGVVVGTQYAAEIGRLLRLTP